MYIFAQIRHSNGSGFTGHFQISLDMGMVHGEVAKEDRWLDGERRLMQQADGGKKTAGKKLCPYEKGSMHEQDKQKVSVTGELHVKSRGKGKPRKKAPWCL